MVLSDGHGVACHELASQDKKPEKPGWRRSWLPLILEYHFKCTCKLMESAYMWAAWIWGLKESFLPDGTTWVRYSIPKAQGAILKPGSVWCLITKGSSLLNSERKHQYGSEGPHLGHALKLFPVSSCFESMEYIVDKFCQLGSACSKLLFTVPRFPCGRKRKSSSVWEMKNQELQREESSALTERGSCCGGDWCTPVSWALFRCTIPFSRKLGWEVCSQPPWFGKE